MKSENYPTPSTNDLQPEKLTASKADLESEIAERKKAEEALVQAQAKLQEYSHNLEKLVDERY